MGFQSTLPYGSDLNERNNSRHEERFQSTLPYGSDCRRSVKSLKRVISIHAPLRERRYVGERKRLRRHFNPRSLTGATTSGVRGVSYKSKFQSTLPYGSESSSSRSKKRTHISIHAPLRERRIKTKYFSINLSQAFFANRLNSNTQEIYFDVRKLLVSHSSSSCEPKLNFMFHITSHRINLDYFSSCQSICK